MREWQRRFCKHHRGAGSKESPGFSLLEMLVVISIIAVLAMLLLVVGKRAMTSLNNAQCLSNLRTWGVLVNQYTADNNDEFPKAFPFNDGKAWYHWSAPMVQNYVLMSKSDRAIDRWNQARGINGCREHYKPYSSYAMNFHLGWQPAVGSYFISKKSQVKRPSKLIIIADAPVDKEASGFSIFAQDRIGKCHSGHFNALYVDGHVESQAEIDPQQIYPDPE